MTTRPAEKLTPKERQFAIAIAGGASMANAYHRIYSERAGRRVAEANARQILKRERVVAEIERLRRYPPADDAAAIRAYAVQKLVDLAEGASSSAVRLRALATLLKDGSRGPRPSPPSPRRAIAHDKKVDTESEIIADLRAVYRQALGGNTGLSEHIKPFPTLSRNDVKAEENITREQENAAPLETSLRPGFDNVERPKGDGNVGHSRRPVGPILQEGAASEADGESAESPDELADVSGAEKLASCDSAETDGRPDVDESGPMFRRVAIPGTFPPRFRRVRIR
jgi:hypothetical protein